METSDDQWLHSACRWLKMSPAEAPTEELALAVKTAPALELESLLEVVSANFDELATSPRRLRILMQLVASRTQALSAESDSDVALIAPDTIARVYDQLSEVDLQAAAHALQMLATQADEESIGALAALLVDSPPDDWQAVGLALSPLWNARADLLELFFDRLDDGFVQPATLATLLDLANYSVRTGRLREHPWCERYSELTSLLGKVTQRLGKLEEDPSQFGDRVEAVQRVLGDSVSLTVSLCDALGLIGNREADVSLNRALELSHRRIQTEAAGALARMGDETGRQRLIDLASDRVARLRAVAYAEELGFAEQIDETLRYPQALAEAELAAWLAGADQFGFPPSEMELIDSRSQYWPSYEEPRDCFLFRYTYQLQANQISNIGIAGPVAHAFYADLANLPVDDIYAAFAGWHVEHDEIFEVPLALLNPAQRREADHLLDSLGEQGLEVTEGIALTFFLGEIALLSRVTKDEKTLCAITDGQELLCYPVTTNPTSLTPELILAIYRGRKLLRTFNN